MILDLIFYIIIFIFGLIVGSFLNCVIYRLASGENLCFSKKSGGQGSDKAGVLFERSHCPICNHILSWQDLIPILSFLTLKGLCRYCRQKISWQYPLVELTTGLLFVSIFNFQFSIFNEFSIFNFSASPAGGQFLTFLYYLLISCFLIVIFVYDLKHYIIPDEVIYPAIAIALIFNFPASPAGGQFSILSAFGAAVFFLFFVLVSRGRWMGVGDVKLAFFMGLFLGWPNIIVALFSAFMFGAIIGTALVVARKKGLKSEIPFGPFLAAGTFIALFLGEKIISWYLNVFI